MDKSYRILGTAALFAVSAVGRALSQATPSDSIPPAANTQNAQTAATQTNPDGTYATGKAPLSRRVAKKASGGM